MSIRLLSYNVRYEGLDTGENAWSERRDGVADLIRTRDPDVVCLQEVWQDQLADLRERLAGYEWVRAPVANGEHTPIGYRPDRFSALEEGAFSLSETPEDLTAIDWEAAIPRVTTTATLADGATDESFAVVNTHFDHASETARRRSADLLAERFGGRTRPTVLAGDFNCTPDEDPCQMLRAAGFADASVAADVRRGPATTFNDFEEPQEGKRIDHVFVDGLDVERIAVFADRDDRGLYPADHFPLVAVVDVP